MDYKQIYTINKKNKERILKCNPNVPEKSGIYFLTREENNFKYAYIGQAKNILQRLADHLKGYQHIDLSIKKHGLYNIYNTTGWRIDFITCEIELLDQKEQEYILEYANSGYQLRNKTSGGQNSGKTDIVDKVIKGYQSGLYNGYNRARKDIAKLFEKNLIVSINGTPNKNKEKALQKFIDFIGVENENINK